MLNSKMEKRVDCSLWQVLPEGDASKTPDCNDGYYWVLGFYNWKSLTGFRRKRIPGYEVTYPKL